MEVEIMPGVLVDEDGVPMDPGLRLQLPEIPEDASPALRRKIRRLQLIEKGRHPLTMLPLSTEAPGDAGPKDRFVRPVTCGSCAHRFLLATTGKRYQKCDLTTSQAKGARSEATSTRLWYPGCMSWREAS
jgi:hypothetical protein